MTLFDTAAVYGWGEGEKLLGRAIEGKRQDIVIVSKGGLLWDAPGGPSQRDSSRESLEKSLDESLTRLGTDYLDLYLIHWPDESRPNGRADGGFRRIRTPGQDQVRRS